MCHRDCSLGETRLFDPPFSLSFGKTTKILQFWCKTLFRTHFPCTSLFYKMNSVYQWVLVNNLCENVGESTHTCTLLVSTLLYYIIVYFYFRRLRVLEERKFTFCVNIKLAPVTVKWAGMPIQLPKLFLSNRKTYEMVSPIFKVWGRTKLLLIELKNIQMYFNLLVNHK